MSMIVVGKDADNRGSEKIIMIIITINVIVFVSVVEFKVFENDKTII